MLDENLLSDELERIQLDFETLEIRVMCKQNLEEFNLGERKIRLTEGVKIKLPYWLAIVLAKEDYVTIEELSDYDFPELHEVTRKERENISLQKIDQFFYILARKTFDELQKKEKVISYRQQQSIETKIREFMTVRLSKIIKMAEKGKNITNKTRNFTPEEKWLFEIVVDAVEKWKEIVKKPKILPEEG